MYVSGVSHGVYPTIRRLTWHLRRLRWYPRRLRWHVGRLRIVWRHIHFLTCKIRSTRLVGLDGIATYCSLVPRTLRNVYYENSQTLNYVIEVCPYSKSVDVWRMIPVVRKKILNFLATCKSQDTSKTTYPAYFDTKFVKIGNRVLITEQSQVCFERLQNQSFYCTNSMLTLKCPS